MLGRQGQSILTLPAPPFENHQHVGPETKTTGSTRLPPGTPGDTLFTCNTETSAGAVRGCREEIGTGKKPTMCLRQAEAPVKAHKRPARRASGGRRSLAEALCQALLRTNKDRWSLTKLRTHTLSLICASHTSCVNKPESRSSQTSSH